MKCLVCASEKVEKFEVRRKPRGAYFHCPICDVIFMDPSERMRPEDEKLRYDMHENVSTQGYRKFFLPLIQEIDKFAALKNIHAPNLKILDFGCGPSAFLSVMLGEKNYRVTNYDIFYFTNQASLQHQYDVITCTEVWEHFYHPLEEIQQLTKLLNPGGLLGVMTSAHQGREHFEGWHYRRDPTHVVFFSERTMTWIADHFGLTLTKAQTPHWIFQT
ncbi:MAG: class I SAM-dependent methyltransferase [Bdellovibrionaceae bacterium]|nr:class I SAM-dependent methyltransferase [Pseudobdellovibrionaceae bacterium]